jgi:UDP-glucose:(heptosyl)LPS alpha-1,3-glucosyltransferase
LKNVTLLKRDLQATGGLEKYSFRICEALQAKGHKVSVLASGASNIPYVVIVAKKLFTSFISMIWFDICVRFWLKKQTSEIVLGLDRHFLPLTHYRAGNGCHAAFLERRRRDSPWWKKVLLSLNPLHALTLFSEKRTFESPLTKIICNSNLVRNEICHFYPKADSSKIFVIHNGVEWNELESVFKEQKCISIPRILFVGHEWERKGLDRLLEALFLIRERPFFLTAIGKERNAFRFEKMVKNFCLEEKVTLFSQPQKVVPFYQEASIMVIPSRYDPFANVTLEALAMGLYVITTKANGGSEVITSDNGIVLEENATPADFSKALIYAFEKIQDVSLPRRIRNSVQNYDFACQLEKFINILCL